MEPELKRLLLDGAERDKTAIPKTQLSPSSLQFVSKKLCCPQLVTKNIMCIDISCYLKDNRLKYF